MILEIETECTTIEIVITTEITRNYDGTKIDKLQVSVRNTLSEKWLFY